MFKRLRTLRSKHHALEDKISKELKRPMPDMMRLQQLKRLKLQLKDKIYALQSIRQRRLKRSQMKTA